MSLIDNLPGGKLAGFECKISIASKLEQVWQIRVAIAAILQELDVADIDRLHVQLAVAEAVNNCIEHAFNRRSDGRVDVIVEIDENLLRIEITDDGQPLPIDELEHLLAKPIPEPSEDMPLLSSGRGLQIMRSTVDSVVFARQGEKNRLVLRKLLRRIYASRAAQ